MPSSGQMAPGTNPTQKRSHLYMVGTTLNNLSTTSSCLNIEFFLTYFWDRFISPVNNAEVPIFVYEGNYMVGCKVMLYRNKAYIPISQRPLICILPMVIIHKFT